MKPVFAGRVMFSGVLSALILVLSSAFGRESCSVNSPTDLRIDVNLTGFSIYDPLVDLGQLLIGDDDEDVTLALVENTDQFWMSNRRLYLQPEANVCELEQARVNCSYYNDNNTLTQVEFELTFLFNTTSNNVINSSLCQTDSTSSRRRRQLPLSAATIAAGANEKPPTFVHPECRPFGGICADVQYTIHVQPGIVPGIQPLQVLPRAIEAKDAEFSKPIAYTFVNGTPANYDTYFFMDPSSGAVSQLRPVPHGQEDYSITFMAREIGTASLHSLARLNIRVDNEAENAHDPVLEASGLQGFVEENSEIGATVRIGPDPDAGPLQILVTDEDLKPGMAPATYQYILMGIGASVFAVNQGGYVYLNVPNLDADGPSPKTYALTIQAREVGTTPIRSSQPLSIKITVIDLNDNDPSFERQVFQTIAYSDTVMQDILKIDAKDTDSGRFGDLQYSIVSVTNNGEPYFRYNKDTGTLVAIAPLELGEQYQILLQATDGGGRTGQTIIVVDTVAKTTTTEATTTTAVETTTAVPFANSYNVTVSESIAPGTAIVRLGSKSGRDGMFRIVAGNDENKFGIDDRGVIKIISQLDRERTHKYRLTIATSGTAPAETVAVMIDVGDENDNAPIITNDKPIMFTVEEDVAEAYVGQLTARDGDAGQNGALEFSIDPSSPSAALFTVNPTDGVIRTKVQLKRQERQEHHFKVSVRDGGSSSKETVVNVTVKVTEKERFLPVFAHDNYIVEIEENAGARELVTVHAASPSGKGPVTYVLKRGDPTLFAVDPTTGVVSTLIDLDAEQHRSHSLIVGTAQNQQTDSGAVTHIELKVKDVNDWTPTFEPQSYSVSLTDTTEIGKAIVRVTAVDHDSDDNNRLIKYRLVDNGNSSQYFTVDSTTGVLTLTRSLRGLRNTAAILLVEARDTGNPPLSSTATVEIKVDSAAAVKPAATNIEFDPQSVQLAPVDVPPRPKFNASHYSLSITEGKEASNFVHILPVHNKPSDLSHVRCSLVSGNYGGVFQVAMNKQGNCELRARGVIDRETVDRYTLNVSVSATASDGRKYIDYCQVSIKVLDTNDNAPRFLYDMEMVGGRRTYVSALSPDKIPLTSVLTVQAVDSDAGPNALVSYSLDPSNSDSQYFSINPNTGEIRNVQTLGPLLEQRDYAPFQFRVVASDNPTTGQSLKANADVLINTVMEIHKFIITLDGVSPMVAEKYIPDIKRVLQGRIGECKIVGVESMREIQESDMISTELTMYAVNPVTKSICRQDEVQSLFDKTNFDYIKKELSNWLTVREVKQWSPPLVEAGNWLFSSDRWQAAEIALIVLAAVIVIGAISGIFAMCYFWSRYKARISASDRMQLYSALPKYNALMVPAGEKEYETQILEMAMPGTASMEKRSHKEFIDTNGIYSINPDKYDVFSQRKQPTHVYIPPPDYPVNASKNGHLSSGRGNLGSDRPPIPAKRNGEKTTIL